MSTLKAWILLLKCHVQKLRERLVRDWVLGISDVHSNVILVLDIS